MKGSTPNRLREWRKKSGMTLDQVSELTGYDSATIHKYEVGKLKLKTEVLPIFAKAYGRNQADFLNVSNQGRPPAVTRDPPATTDADSDDHVYFDGLRYAAIRSFDLSAAAGDGAELPGLPAVKHRALFRQDWLRAITTATMAYLAIIRVDGDSMTPSLHDGDSVLIDRTQRRPDQRAGIYVINNDGMSQIKRVAAHPVKKTLSIVSDNPLYPSYHDLAPDLIDIVGRVIWIGRQA